MTPAKTALLPDRGVVRVAGEDAQKLLQGIITNDMDLLAKQPAIHTALLSPQGKILFEFFVVKSGDGFLLETVSDQVAALVKRLTMYRLRAKVEIRDASAEYRVLVVWGASACSSGETKKSAVFADPRLPGLGSRILAEAALASDAASATNGHDATPTDFHAHRIFLGVPEAGKDYVLGDIFPHEANFDLLNGVSFTKGCFVGQEVVSRMQHRGGARKRIVIVEGAGPLQSGSAIETGPATIGTVGSVAGHRALALIRLDRAEEAKTKGQALTAGGCTLTVRLPSYLQSVEAARTP